MRFEWTVGAADAGRRLDRFLQSRLGEELGGLPSSRIQRMLRKGDVKVNGLRGRGSIRLEPGDLVVAHHRKNPVRKDPSVPPGKGPARPGAPAPPGKGPAGDDRPLPSYRGPSPRILHEGTELVVVDKPAHVACDPGEGGWPGLLHWAQLRYAEAVARGDARPAAPHRLDEGTTGAVTVTLTASAQDAFRQAQQEGRVHKSYLVVVWGHPPRAELETRIPLGRLAHAPRDRPKMVPVADGPEGVGAHTRFRLLARGTEASLLEAEPITGRTHQIRAHLRALDLPVVGDPRYGDPRRDASAGLFAVLDHQLLHAAKLSLSDPARGFAVEAPLPAEFQTALGRLGIELAPG